MTEYTRISNRFEYHAEDLDCKDCLHYINRKTRCGEETCRFEDIRQDAIANGRFKRPKGWFKWRA
jgi:hypothetical protein